MSKNTLPLNKKMEFTVDPFQGFASLAVGMSVPGYNLVRISRKGTKATAHFRRK